MPELDGFYRYLTAKRSVDDRALNRVVLDTLRIELGNAEQLDVIEIGGGVGTMLARLVESQLLRNARYTLVDVDPQGLEHAREWLAEWTRRMQGEVESGPSSLRIRLPQAKSIEVEFVQADVTRREQLARIAPADLLIANAFLDLIDVPRALPSLWQLLRPSGLFWFSINFDGETIFTPDHPHDAQLLALYHHTMDARIRDGKPSGDSRTGRHLFGHLAAAGAELLSAGASDWVVHPVAGRYPEDERFFLEYIVDTIERALRAIPEVDASILDAWANARREQIARNELVFIAHQLDFAGRAPG